MKFKHSKHEPFSLYGRRGWMLRNKQWRLRQLLPYRSILVRRMHTMYGRRRR